MVIEKTNDGEKHKSKEIQIKHELPKRRGRVYIYIYIHEERDEERMRRATKLVLADTTPPPGGYPDTFR